MCRGFNRVLAIFVAVLIQFSYTGQAASEPAAPTEYQVKAVFIYNFTKFIEWPKASFPEKGSPINLCLLGEEPFGKTIDILAGKTSKNRKFNISRTASYQDGEEFQSCQILFVSRSEKDKVKDILDSLKNSGVLTISDIKGFAGSGGVIGFKVVRNKVRFSVNIKAAEKAGLKISSKLLKLAEIAGK